MNGKVGVYGSFIVRNPSPITADFVIEGSDTLYYYIENDGKKNHLFLTVISLSSVTITLQLNMIFYDATTLSK